MKSKHRYFPWLREFHQTQPHSHSLPPLTPSTLPGFSVLHLRHGLLPGFCHFACLPQTKCLSSADFGFLCRLLSLTCLYLHLLRPGHPLRNQAPGPGLQPSQGTAPGERGWVSGSTGSSPVGASAVSTVCSRVQWPCRAQCVQLSLAWEQEYQSVRRLEALIPCLVFVKSLDGKTLHVTLGD